MPEDEQEEGGPAPPRGPGFRALLRDSWALFSGHITTLLALFFPAFLALSLIQAAILIPLAESSSSDFVGGFIQVGVFFVLGGIVGSFVVALAALIADRERTGEPATIGGAWNSVRPLSREVLGAGFLAAVLAMAISFVGLQQLLRPVFFGPPVIVHAIALEGLPLAGAWPRAKALLKGNWGRALLYLAVISLAMGLVQALVSTGILEALGDLSDDAVDFVIFGPVRGLLDGIMLPFLAVAMYVLYRQLEADGAGEPAPPTD
ncbi:MAG: hypothetical protein ACRDKB_11750 [Actinomycetota bacterium]